MDYAIQKFHASLRQACRAFEIHLSVYYYKPKPNNDQEVRDQLTALAELHNRWGFWMMFHRLRNAGFKWNHKRVYRIYTEMNLNLRRKTKKRVPARIMEPLLQPIYANETWSMDFMSDALSNTVKFRSLNIIDDFNRECLTLTLDTSINSHRVIRELNRIIAWRGAPRKIRVDNGPEYIAQALADWCKLHKIELKHIQKGSPYQNGFIERFNKSFREEVLDAHSFTRLKEARDFALAWVWMYNNERPHESLGYLPPVQFAQQRLRSEAPASLLTDYPNQWKSLILNVNN